jgi:hypothetical protein
VANLRLAEEVLQAAKHFSLYENTDVEILSVGGSRTLFVKGEDATPVWFAAPAPQVQAGEPIPYADLTPREIRLGRWMDERFVSSVVYPVDRFLDLYRLSTRRS